MQRRQQLGHIVMGDRHPLGDTGGARGVDHIGDVIGGRRRQRRARVGVNAGVVDIDDQQIVPIEPISQPRGGDRGDRRGVSQHEPDPRRRQGRVDRQISRPGLEHRQDRHDRLSRPGKQQRHTLPRARPLAGQQMRQPVRRLIELAIRQRPAFEGQRHRLRSTRHLRGKQHRNRHRGGRRLGQHRPITDPSSRACSPTPSKSTDDNRWVGSAAIATNTRSNRSTKSWISQFENNCPAPGVLR